MHHLTAGLVGPRDAAQPLLTYLDGPARVELSGTTTANWVAKTANLLVDGYGSPDRVGLLLPLHWQTVCLLLGAVAADATVVVASDPSELADCPIAFVSAEQATAAADAGVEDVLACSLTPFASRLPVVPALCLDAALEIPGYGDHFGGRPAGADVRLGDRPFTPGGLDIVPSDRVLTTLNPATAEGLAALLEPLRVGAALVLLAAGDLERAILDEQVTAVVDEQGLRRL